MRATRTLVLIVLFLIAVAAAWWFTARQRTSGVGETIAVYYAKADGTTLVPWRLTLKQNADRVSAAYFAATQCVAGPPPGTDAIRFPDGTRVLDLHVQGSTADVDISKEVAKSAEGGFAESAEFKALVWTLTQPQLGIDAVRVRVGGERVATLPGGHLELDEPLSRSSF